MLMQDSRLVPELIPICRDIVRSSKRDWLAMLGTSANRSASPQIRKLRT